MYRLTISETSPDVDLDQDNHTTSTSEEQMKYRSRRNSHSHSNATQYNSTSRNAITALLSNKTLKRSLSSLELSSISDETPSSRHRADSQTDHSTFSTSFFKEYLKFKSLHSFLQKHFQLLYSKIPRSGQSMSCPLCGKTLSAVSWEESHYKTCNALPSLYFSQFNNSSRLKSKIYIYFSIKIAPIFSTHCLCRNR